MKQWCEYTFQESHKAIRWPQLRWLLFFLATHIVQPTPLAPEYFSHATSEDRLNRLRSRYAITLSQNVGQGDTADALMELHKAVCYALCMGNLLFTESVKKAWKVYAARMGYEEDVMAVRLIHDVKSDSPGFMSLLQYYVTAHTLSVYKRVDTKPRRSRLSMEEDDGDADDNVSTTTPSLAGMDLEDDLLKNVLEDLFEPTVTIYILAQDHDELMACDTIYRRYFPGEEIETVHVNDAVSVQQGPPTTPLKPGFVWRKATARWDTQPNRVFVTLEK
jgi:hypothetical protein